MTIAAVESKHLRGARSLWASSLTGVLGVLGVFAPKCPVCIAAYLSAFGVSAGSAVLLARVELPLCIALLASSLLGAIYFVSKRQRAPRATCCRR